jgi:predicted Zn-dependent peptidase
MNYKKTVLENGLRLITVPMKNVETVTVVIMTGTGSRYETEKEAGLSHFLEHMFFKGTKKRPTTLDISEELDATGGEYNAFTGKDRTAYYAKVDAKHLDKALDVISDMYLNSKIEEAEIEKEKGTILQELNMYEDTPYRNIGDIFETLLYDGNPLGREVIGYKETIKSFKREDFMDYMSRHYVAQDAVVCIAGKFDQEEAIAKAENYFGKIRKGEKPKFLEIIENQSGPAIKLKKKKTDQTHFILGVRAYSHDNPDRFALNLLSVILGGNMSSRLFIEVREKRGLAYSVKTDAEMCHDCGYLATQAGVEHANLELAVKTILDEYKKISEKKASEKELQKAKDFIKGRSVMSFESSDEVAMFFVDQEALKGKIMTMEKIFEKIDAVTPEDIQRVAKDIFRENNLNLAVIGPQENAEEIKSWLKI